MKCTHHSYQILMKLNFLSKFSKNVQTSNFTTIRPEGAELLHAGRQTGGREDGREADMKKQVMTFRILRTHLIIQN